MVRGKNVFARIQSQIPLQQTENLSVNDFFLYALFARIAFRNNHNIEFETKYDKNSNTIELQVPTNYLDTFDEMLGIQRGPNFKKFVNWLIGSQTLQTSGGVIDGQFISVNSLNLWFGASYLDVDGNKLVILLPPSQQSAINSSIKTSDTHDGDLSISLVWMYLSGNNNNFDIKVNVTITNEFGDATVYSELVSISTFNLIANDTRTTELISINDVGPNTIVDIMIYRNYGGSADPGTDVIGVVGLLL